MAMKSIAAMMPVMVTLLALIANANVAEADRIVPELQPVDDKKFMHQDYPDDRRPKVYHKFDYPYPTVQDSEDYDKDYVEDKNDDGGYWLAQMKYDELKNTLAKEQDELKAALRDLEKQQKEVEEAKKREADAELAAKEAEEKEKLADMAAGQAKLDADNADAEIDGMKDKANGEITDLEVCKRQLREARSKLKVLIDEKKKYEDAKKAKDANEEGAENAEVDAEQKEAAAEKSRDEAQKDYDGSVTVYKTNLDKVKEAEQALAKQASVLAKFRKGAVDQDGGVYWVKKEDGNMFSGSMSMAALSSAVLLAVVVPLL